MLLSLVVGVLLGVVGLCVWSIIILVVVWLGSVVDGETL